MEWLHYIVNFSADVHLLKFIGNNIVTMGVLFVLLRGLAEISPWKWDEKIVSVFWACFEMLRPNGKKKPE